ncbi:MAG: HAMP domain-containing sensor histidine kinase [Gallionellaceae bacterium]|nr:HAMP domain-containing sensor histidine kinase [Gallionellaceae bacterium]
MVTACLVAIPFLIETHDEVKRDMLFDSEALGLTLAGALNTSLIRQDFERAQEIVQAPFVAQQNNSYFQFEAILVVDMAGRVFASSLPDAYRSASDIRSYSSQFAKIWTRLAGNRRLTVFDDDGEKTLVAVPIHKDGLDLGNLIIVHTPDFYLDRFLEAALRAAVLTLIALGLLLPLSWYWGARMARPLTLLAGRMRTPEGGLPEPLPSNAYPYRDELGQLFNQFDRLTAELRDKERVRLAAMESEHLAALGRMTAGIAHEINNPLGGLLTAIDTLKRYGKHDPVADRVVPMLERGLKQIQETVSAMLVEVRTGKQRPLNRQDIEDVLTIVRQGTQKPGAQLVMNNGIAEEVPLPANLIRQILINLLLNACQAAGQGNVHTSITRSDSGIVIAVDNTGPAIPEAIRDRLFEPRVGANDDGHGLGLWVTRQIVEQLRGKISAESRDGLTRFTVALPLGEPA